MKTFQQPLTAGEEAYYIRLLREGTVEEAIQAKEILVERNLRLEAAGDPDGFVWTVFVIRKIHALRYAGSHLFQYADPVLWSGNELSAERE